MWNVLIVTKSKYNSNKLFFCNRICQKYYHTKYFFNTEHLTISENEKVCNTCGKIKNISEFRPKRNTCKKCCAEQRKNNYLSISINYKTCNKCNKTKPVSEFYKSGTKDGYEGQCKECHKKFVKIHKSYCTFCKKEFYSDTKNRKFCSFQCSTNSNIIHTKKNVQYAINSLSLRIIRLNIVALNVG